MAFNKGILAKVNGYYFDENLSWTEDYDFDIRVKSASLKILYDDNARIIHPELSIKQDLKSSFNYGIGHARGVLQQKNGYYEPKNKLRSIINSYKYIKKKIRLFNCFLSHILADCLL